MIYLALGDSITFGYDASDEAHRFVNILAGELNQVMRTSIHLHAKPGWTSSQLLRSLEKIPDCILEEAQLISLMIGGNDLIKVMPWYLDDPERAQERLRKSFYPQVLAIVDKVKRNSDAILMICTVYNPFPKSEIAQKALADLNGFLRDVAAKRSCVVVPVDEWYGGSEEHFVNGYRRGELQDFRLVRNPIHPNDAGHERIAKAILTRYLTIRRQRQAVRKRSQLTTAAKPKSKKRLKRRKSASGV